MIKTRRDDWLDNLIIILIFLASFLRYYDVPIVNVSFDSLFAVTVIFLCFLLFLVRYNMRVEKELKKSRAWYAVFLFWCFIVTLGYELFTNISLSNPNANYNAMSLLVKMLFAVLIFFIVGGYINTSKCISVYHCFIVFVIAIYLFQWLLMLGNIKISFKLPFDFNSGWSYLNSHRYFGMNSYPTSLFSERSHICEFIVPYIALCLYSKNLIKNRIRNAVICTIIVISTVSGNGIVIVFLEWLMFFLIFGNIKKLSSKIFIGIIGILALLGAYIVLSSIPRFSDMFNILFVNNSGSEFVHSKADYRIYRGIDIFMKMPLNAKLFGVGYGHMYLYSQAHNIVSIYDYSEKIYEYFSAFSMVLMYFGLIGLYFAFRHFLALFKAKSYAVKGLIMIMMALWLSTEMLFNCTHVLFILLIVSALRADNSFKSEVAS